MPKLSTSPPNCDEKDLGDPNASRELSSAGGTEKWESIGCTVLKICSAVRRHDDSVAMLDNKVSRSCCGSLTEETGDVNTRTRTPPDVTYRVCPQHSQLSRNNEVQLSDGAGAAVCVTCTTRAFNGRRSFTADTIQCATAASISSSEGNTDAILIDSRPSP